MSASTATRTDEFTDFVRSHSSVLMRSACLIAGDRGKGEDLFRRAAPPVELDDARAEALAPAPDPYGAVDDRLDIVARLGLLNARERAIVVSRWREEVWSNSHGWGR